MSNIDPEIFNYPFQLVVVQQALMALVAEKEDAVAAERERCARIAEASVEALKDVGFEQNNKIRRKHGICIAAKIRSGE